MTSIALALTVLALTTARSQDAEPKGVFLGQLSWPEAEKWIAEVPIVIIPFGAGAKEHGPHLPMNADQVVMEHLLERAVQEERVLAIPPVLHGWFPAFRGFPGTEVRDPEVFREYVFEVARSLADQGARRLVFLNTGISKATGLPLSIVAREIRTNFGVPTLVVSWDDLETEEIAALEEQRAGGHGGEIETSIHLFLQPNLVRLERAVTDMRSGGSRDHPGYSPGLFSRDPNDPAYSKTGLYGDPKLATAEKGQKALQILEAQWLKALRGFAKAPLARR